MARWIWALCAAAAVWVAGYWLAESTGAVVAPGVKLAARPASQATETAVPGQGGTAQVARRPADAYLTPGLRMDIEDMVLEVLHDGSFDKDPAGFRQKLLERLKARHPPEYVARMQGLLERYVDYRMALGRLDARGGDAHSPDRLRETLGAMRTIRRQYFDDAEYDALFGASDRLDAFTLKRLEIQRNGQGSPADKAAALQALEAEMLTLQERQHRTEATVGAAVQEQTGRYDAQATGAAQRLAERTQQFGADAARRLAGLDAEEAQWKARLGEYVQARAQQEAGQITMAQLDALRTRMFNPQEQLRLPGALELMGQPAR